MVVIGDMTEEGVTGGIPAIGVIANGAEHKIVKGAR